MSRAELPPARVEGLGSTSAIPPPDAHSTGTWLGYADGSQICEKVEGSLYLYKGELAADTATREKLGLSVKETWDISEYSLEEATEAMEEAMTVLQEADQPVGEDPAGVPGTPTDAAAR